MQPENDPNAATWSFKDESAGSQVPAGPNEAPEAAGYQTEPITWTGSEFISQHKSVGWYFLWFGFIAAVCAVVYVISKDFIPIVFITIGGILIAIIAGRKPRQLQYMIDDQGLQIGAKRYLFNDFKSFSLQKDGAIGYVSLLPLRRLHNELSIYFAPEDEQRIFQALAQHIPNEQRKESVVDKFARQIRF